MSIGTVTNFIKNWKQTGAVGPLSHKVATTVGSLISRHSHNVGEKLIVEYGVGDGVLTQELISLGKVIGYEVNQEFCEQVVNKLGNSSKLEIHNESCESVINRCEANSVDGIVTTIPMSLIQEDNPTSLRNILQHSHTVLKHNGLFILVQVSKKQNKAVIELFGEPIFHTTVRSIRFPIPLLVQVNVFRK